MAIKTRFIQLWKEKEIKENRSITLTEISEQTGIGWGTVNRWKREQVNRYDESVLDALCLYFECDIGDLLQHVKD